MFKRYITSSLIIIWVTIIGVFSGCGGANLVPVPTDYPADIIGDVKYAGYLTNIHGIDEKKVAIQPKQGNVFAIVNIAIKNKDYPCDSNWHYWNWAIVLDGTSYRPPETFKILITPFKDLRSGETAYFTNCFEVPDNINAENAQLVYHGRENNSYGVLVGGTTVAGYDFAEQRITGKIEREFVVQTKVADNWRFELLNSTWSGSTLKIKLRITNLGNRRYFGDIFSKVDILYAVDSTNKAIESGSTPYEKEYYPNESWEGTLKYVMSPYSGSTKLLLLQYHTRNYILFDFGAPK